MEVAPPAGQRCTLRRVPVTSRNWAFPGDKLGKANLHHLGYQHSVRLEFHQVAFGSGVRWGERLTPRGNQGYFLDEETFLWRLKEQRFRLGTAKTRTKEQVD